MSTVTLIAPWDLKDVIAVDCGHFIYCSGAAVKVARMEELRKILNWFPDGSNPLGKAVIQAITERIAELEAL